MELESPIIELPLSPEEPVYVQQMNVIKTKLWECRNKLRSLSKAALNKQSKKSGLVSLVEEIQDLITDMGYLDNCDSSYDITEEFRWLNGQLICLQGRVNKEMLLVNGSKPKLSENITSVMSEKKVEHY